MTPVPQHNFFEKQRLSSDRTPLKDMVDREPFHRQDKNESSQMSDIMSWKERKSSVERPTSGSNTKKELNAELTQLQSGK